MWYARGLYPFEHLWRTLGKKALLRDLDAIGHAVAAEGKKAEKKPGQSGLFLPLREVSA